MAGRLPRLPRQTGPRRAAGQPLASAPVRPAAARLPHRRRVPRRGAARTIAPGRRRVSRWLLFLFQRHRKRRPVLAGLLRAHVVPSHEQGDRVRIVNRLDGDARRGRMEGASRLHDLPDDRKAGHGSRGEARGPLGQIDRLTDVLGHDEVGIARPVAARERDDEVGDRPSLLGRERVEERRHRRAVEPRAHRPEDVLAGRPAAERPALRQVRRADRMAPVVLQGWRRRSVAPAERAVAPCAAGLFVELLAELDRLVRCISARLGSGTACAAFSGFENSGEKLVTK